MYTRGWEWRTHQRRRVVTRRTRLEFVSWHGRIIDARSYADRIWVYLIAESSYRKNEYRRRVRVRYRYWRYNNYYYRPHFTHDFRQECADSELLYAYHVAL